MKSVESNVGLCSHCAHCRVVNHPRGGVDYLRCGLSETDPTFPKYPPLPVLRCEGYSGAST